jgi:hypothetical protein
MLGLFKHDEKERRGATWWQPVRSYASPNPTLALQAHLERRPDGLAIRLPLRREEIEVEKRAVTVEQVVVRRSFRTETEQLSETVRREQPTVDEDGAYARTERIGM